MFLRCESGKSVSDMPPGRRQVGGATAQLCSGDPIWRLGWNWGQLCARYVPLPLTPLSDFSGQAKPLFKSTRNLPSSAPPAQPAPQSYAEYALSGPQGGSAPTLPAGDPPNQAPKPATKSNSIIVSPRQVRPGWVVRNWGSAVAAPGLGSGCPPVLELGASGPGRRALLVGLRHHLLPTSDLQQIMGPQMCSTADHPDCLWGTCLSPSLREGLRVGLEYRKSGCLMPSVLGLLMALPCCHFWGVPATFRNSRGWS